MKKHNLFKILAIMILVFVVLSWIIPTGYLSGTEIQKAEELTRIGIWNVFNMFTVSASSFITYPFYLITVGVFYLVLNKTGVYQRMVTNFAKKLKKYPKLFLAITISLFAIISSVTNLGLMLFLLVPFFISVILKLGYDKFVALASTIGAIFVGIIGSTYGYYVSKIINSVLNLDFTSNIIAKVALLVVSTALLILYEFSYIKRDKKPKSKDVVKEEVKDELLIETDKNSNKKSWPMILVMVLVLVITFLSAIAWNSAYGFEVFTKFHESVMNLSIGKDFNILQYILGAPVNIGYYAQYGIKELGGWDYTDLSIMLIFASLIIGLMYKVKFSDILDSFKDSGKKFAKASLLIIVAYTLFVLNYYIPVFTTVIGWVGNSFNIVTSSLIAILSSVINIDMMYVAQGTLATVSAIFDDVALNPTLAVLYQAMYGLTSFFAPTSILLITGLCYLNISYKEWMKHIWKFLLELLVVILIVLIILMVI
ncbi:MAG: hypothetical protein E7166_03260 [Firmicutes bacterium]|nr:hypothetical protein [Bacillota bacterium]